jgi:hypothetical protein
MRYVSGSITKYLYFVLVDATDLKTRETGATGFVVYRSRNGAASAVYTTPTINETDTTNMPGVYELLLDEDMTIDSGDDSQEVCLHITATGCAPVTRVFELYRPKITAGNTLDVTATGAGGIDWGNIENPTTAQNLSATNIDVDQVVASVSGTCATVTTLTNLPAITANWLTATGINADAITAAKIANGAIDAATFAAGAIDAAAIATGAIDADAFAADAGTEIAAAVWNEDATGHQTLGTFGQAIGDPVADTNTIYKAVVTDATGATVGIDVVAVKAETAAILVDTGTTLDAALAVVDGNVDSILVDTAEIGAAGAGLTAINLPNQTMDITGNITGNLSGSVGSVTGAVGSVTGLTAATVHSDLDDIQARLPAALVGGLMSATVTAIDGNAASAANLKQSTLAIGTGVVGAASTTTSIVTSSMSPAAAVTDQFKGRIVSFAEDTTTVNLRGQSTDITGNTAAGVLTVTALTTAPVSGDTFSVT